MTEDTVKLSEQLREMALAHRRAGCDLFRVAAARALHSRGEHEAALIVLHMKIDEWLIKYEREIMER